MGARQEPSFQVYNSGKRFDEEEKKDFSIPERSNKEPIPIKSSGNSLLNLLIISAVMILAADSCNNLFVKTVPQNKVKAYKL